MKRKTNITSESENDAIYNKDMNYLYYVLAGWISIVGFMAVSEYSSSKSPDEKAKIAEEQKKLKKEETKRTEAQQVKNTAKSKSPLNANCNASEVRSLAIERMGITGTVHSAEVSNAGDNKWLVTGLVFTNYGTKTMAIGIVCNNGSLVVTGAQVL